jgi:hypothetical protein
MTICPGILKEHLLAKLMCISGQFVLFSMDFSRIISTLYWIYIWQCSMYLLWMCFHWILLYRIYISWTYVINRIYFTWTNISQYTMTNLLGEYFLLLFHFPLFVSLYVYYTTLTLICPYYCKFLLNSFYYFNTQVSHYKFCIWNPLHINTYIINCNVQDISTMIN